MKLNNRFHIRQPQAKSLDIMPVTRVNPIEFLKNMFSCEIIVYVLADIRRKTRSQYHLALRRVKQNKLACSANKMAQGLIDNNQRDFWSEIRRLKGSQKI